MTIFYGLASAIYSRNPSKITTTILAGERKDAIRVVDTTTTNFYSPSRRIVNSMISTLEAKVRELAGKQQGDGIKVPIVTGTESDYEVGDLFSMLSSIYGAVPVPCFSLTGLDARTFTIGELERVLREKPNSYRWEAYGRSVCALLERVAPDKLHVDPPRGYDHAEKIRQNVAGKDNVLDVVEAIKEGLEEPTNALLDRWDVATDEQEKKAIEKDLHTNALEYAQRVAQSYFLRKLHSGNDWDKQRFFMASEETRARLFMVPHMRDAYGTRLKELLGIKHNICVKGIFDPKNPPYADVTTAIMADYMDTITGDSPGLVMVAQN